MPNRLAHDRAIFLDRLGEYFKGDTEGLSAFLKNELEFDYNKHLGASIWSMRYYAEHTALHDVDDVHNIFAYKQSLEFMSEVALNPKFNALSLLVVLTLFSFVELILTAQDAKLPAITSAEIQHDNLTINVNTLIYSVAIALAAVILAALILRGAAMLLVRNEDRRLDVDEVRKEISTLKTVAGLLFDGRSMGVARCSDGNRRLIRLKESYWYGDDGARIQSIPGGVTAVSHRMQTGDGDQAVPVPPDLTAAYRQMLNYEQLSQQTGASTKELRSQGLQTYHFVRNQVGLVEDEQGTITPTVEPGATPTLEGLEPGIYAFSETRKHTLRGRPPRTAHEAACVLADITKQVAFLHKHDITIADLKPENIFIDGKGDAHLADYLNTRTDEAGKTVATHVTPGFFRPQNDSGEHREGQTVQIHAAHGALLQQVSAMLEDTGNPTNTQDLRNSQQAYMQACQNHYAPQDGRERPSLTPILETINQKDDRYALGMVILEVFCQSRGWHPKEAKEILRICDSCLNPDSPHTCTLDEIHSCFREHMLLYAPSGDDNGFYPPV